MWLAGSGRGEKNKCYEALYQASWPSCFEIDDAGRDVEMKEICRSSNEKKNRGRKKSLNKTETALNLHQQLSSIYLEDQHGQESSRDKGGVSSVEHRTPQAKSSLT